jgi:predicted site-specific integrase-resolvase
MLDTSEVAARLGICESTVKRWHEKGLLQGCKSNDKGDWLYHMPQENSPIKDCHSRHRIVRSACAELPEQLQEV